MSVVGMFIKTVGGGDKKISNKLDAKRAPTEV